MINNYHTHTKRCLHAYGTEEDYVKEAIKAGMGQLGFSDHGPFSDHDYGYRMPYDELDSYIEEIDRLSSEYQGRIKLLKGLEIEYFPEYSDYYRLLLEEKHLDYLALGEHSYCASSGEQKNIFFADSTGDYLEYAENVCKAIRSGFFRFTAHPDLMFINDLPFDSRAEEACRMIVQCASENNTILEYNANGLRRERRKYPDGIRNPYPYRPFWEMVRETDIPVLIGSDCHSPDQVCDHSFMFARREALSLGLNVIDTLF